MILARNMRWSGSNAAISTIGSTPPGCRDDVDLFASLASMPEIFGASLRSLPQHTRRVRWTAPPISAARVPAQPRQMVLGAPRCSAMKQDHADYAVPISRCVRGESSAGRCSTAQVAGGLDGVKMAIDIFRAEIDLVDGLTRLSLDQPGLDFPGRTNGGGTAEGVISERPRLPSAKAGGPSPAPREQQKRVPASPGKRSFSNVLRPFPPLPALRQGLAASLERARGPL